MLCTHLPVLSQSKMRVSARHGDFVVAGGEQNSASAHHLKKTHLERRRRGGEDGWKINLADQVTPVPA